MTEKLRGVLVEAAAERYDLPAEAILMNASHTHCGPASMREGSEEYFANLTQTLIDLVGQSLEQMEPAVLSWSQSCCGRRTRKARLAVRRPVTKR